MPDYPKLGIWQEPSGAYSGVYFSANLFANGNTFTGADACALPASAVTTPPNSLQLVCQAQSTSAYNMLRADIDGVNDGPSGSGELYLQFVASNGVGNSLALYQYQPDFNNPGNSHFSLLRNLAVNTFHEACGGSSCIPQYGTHEQLDSLGDRLMYRLAYRNNGSGGDSLLVNHSVQVSSSSSLTGVRWYDIQNVTSTSPVITEGVYSPDSTFYRWMGSIAQDKYGDFGLAYSTSSSSSYPGLAFTGRTTSDSPANALEPEQILYTGSGAQTRVNRWGDYSSTSLDPSDDCTFWYTNEYLQSTGSYTNWGTVLTSFRFPSCTN